MFEADLFLSQLIESRAATHLHQAAITTRLTSCHHKQYGGWGCGAVRSRENGEHHVPLTIQCNLMELTVMLAHMTASWGQMALSVIQETPYWHLHHPTAVHIVDRVQHWWRLQPVGPTEVEYSSWPVDVKCCYLTDHRLQHAWAIKGHTRALFGLRLVHCPPPVLEGSWCMMGPWVFPLILTDWEEATTIQWS